MTDILFLVVFVVVVLQKMAAEDKIPIQCSSCQVNLTDATCSVVLLILSFFFLCFLSRLEQTLECLLMNVFARENVFVCGETFPSVYK